MANINNSDLKKEIIDGAKINISREVVPTQLAEKVVPVMEVNPKLLRYASVIAAASNSVTGNVEIYTTPANKDFYLTNACFSYDASVAADNTEIVMFCTPDKAGASTNFASMQKATLTAKAESMNISFTTPIKCERGTIIGVYSSFTAGDCTKSGNIIGYTVED